jgi:hypothetical protein
MYIVISPATSWSLRLLSINYQDRKVNEVGKPIGKNHLQKIIPIRVSVEDWERLRKQAQGMGIGVSTLTRIWVMERLGDSGSETVWNNSQAHRTG